MLSIRLLSLLIPFVGLSHAAPRPAPAGHVLHEARALSHKSNWVKRSRIEQTAILPVRIGLSQTNLDKGHDALMEVSHPDSPNYGKWWSPEDVHDFFAPAAETVDLVRTWIKSAGIDHDRIVHSENKGWLAVDATVAEAEMLFATIFHEYEHSETEDLAIGTDSYHLPEHLVPHIDYVSPGVKRVRVKRQTVEWKANPMKRNVKAEPKKHHARSLRIGDGIGNGPETKPDSVKPQDASDASTTTSQVDPSLQNCWMNMTIPCIRAMYGLPENPQAAKGNEMGVFAAGDYFDQPDLDAYYANLTPWVPQGVKPIPALINGAQYDTSQDDTAHILGETITDVCISQAIIYPQKVTLYQTDDPIYGRQQLYSDGRWVVFNNLLNALDGSYCSYTAFGQTGNDPKVDPAYPNPNATGYQGQLMCGVYKPTKVISISYGEAELDIPPNYFKRECNEFLKLGLMGTSIVVSSGDTGVAAVSRDGGDVSGCLGPDHTIFNPGHPRSCPYVTVVGATQLHHNETYLDGESVMNLYFPGNNATGQPAVNFTSGGGWSNYFPQPDYQKAALSEYFAKYDPGYPSYSQMEPDLSKVQGLYNRIGRAYPDVAANGVQQPVYIFGQEQPVYGSSVAAPLFGSVLTLLNQERALIGKSSIGFVNAVLYSYPDILNDITKGKTLGCGIEGLPAVPGWDPGSGLGTPNYEKMRQLFLTLP